jgi:hypothetical protein
MRRLTSPCEHTQSCDMNEPNRPGTQATSGLAGRQDGNLSKPAGGRCQQRQPLTLMSPSITLKCRLLMNLQERRRTGGGQEAR